MNPRDSVLGHFPINPFQKRQTGSATTFPSRPHPNRFPLRSTAAADRIAKTQTHHSPARPKKMGRQDKFSDKRYRKGSYLLSRGSFLATAKPPKAKAKPITMMAMSVRKVPVKEPVAS